ncbi:MAG: 6-phosphofructokinase [Planctomycetes bacterium]|jgi:6-phosphofructokinase 1|nr:6-phosphofructokinase [Planctomycetota bacterium]
MAGREGNILIAQGGGPTAVINQSLAGAVLAARRFARVKRVYGAVHGVRGIVDENLVDLTDVTGQNLADVADTPSSALCSTRDKPDAAYCARIFASLKAHDVGWFFYIGGNDSADTCRILSEEARKASYPLHVCHVPKTIDNDLLVTDHCPGFGSAARFVAQAFAGANLDNRSIPGVYISVVMGRHAGFLTAAAALGRRWPDDGPHLVYLPERTFDRDRFLADVKEVYARLGRCVVAVSEGIHDEAGVAIASKFTGGEKDAHGNVQLSGTGALGDLLASFVKDGAKIKRVRADTLGYLQRSFLGCVSETDRREAREAGEAAVGFCVGGDRDGSVVIRRVADYAVEYDFAELSAVAKSTKRMVDEYINEAGNDVTEAFLRYARPLAGDLPLMARLAAPKVAKRLG